MFINVISNTLSPDDVPELAARFEGRSPEELLTWAMDEFGERIVLTCSWQRTSSVLIDLISRIGGSPRIVEIDTGLLFPETHETRSRLVERYGIEVETVMPHLDLDEQAAAEGPSLWRTDAVRCCFLRKVEPLQRTLAGMDAWITGIRRDQATSRANARPIEWDPAHGVIKLQPLVAFSDQDVENYLREHDVPYNPLHDMGYPSIGCTPCTRPVLPGEDARSGRWSGSEKTECGLHTTSQR